MKQIWEMHLNDELAYWESMIAGTFHNKDWVAGFRRRTAGIDIAPYHLRKYLQRGRILDVGSGPATVLGGVLGGRRLDITAIDPLAEKYMDLYRKYGIEPLVQPVYGEAENLSASCSGRFDFVYSHNSLDHSYDPIRAIQSMIDICAADGCVIFEDAINEGCKENYKGLHQWNFMNASGDLVIWKQDGSAFLTTKELNRFKSLEISTVRTGWLMVKIEVLSS